MYHYKDARPEHTIRRIRKIFERIGIAVEIDHYQVVDKGFHSVRLALSGTGGVIGTNGKGMTRNLALASAYGEFMERLQNNLLFYRHAHDPVMESGPRAFYHAPDEAYIPAARLADEFPAELTRHFLSCTSHASGRSELQQYLWRTPFKRRDKCITIPFYSVRRGRTVDIPLGFVKESHGMCAGNTPEEALTQGISEILERHVFRQILFHGYTPPDIPDRYLQQNCPDLYASLKRMERRHTVRFVVKDCSLGGVFPVIGIIVVNDTERGYFVKFGAHPIPGIALERALTELFQGKDLRSFSYMPFEEPGLSRPSSEQWLMWCKGIRNGQARYRSNLFSSKFSHPLRLQFKAADYKNNRDLLSFLLALLKNLRWDLLVRDVGFLGFPAYHVIVPESPFNCFNRCPYEMPAEFDCVPDLLHRLKHCSQPEMRVLMRYFRQKDATGARPVFSKSLRVVLRHSDKLDLFDALLPAGLYYTSNRVSAAAAYVRHAAANTHGDDRNRAVLRCAQEFLSMEVKKLPLTQRISVLRNRFGAGVTAMIVNFFLADMKGFGAFTELPCPDCSRCESRPACAYDQRGSFDQKLRKIMADNPIDQRSLAEFF